MAGTTSMADRMFTVADKLRTVELLIEDFRWARNDDALPEHLTYRVLKAIASDLRGRMNGSAEDARREIGLRIAGAIRSKTALGYERGMMLGVAEELIGRWPVIEQALERFEAELRKSP